MKRPSMRARVSATAVAAGVVLALSATAAGASTCRVEISVGHVDAVDIGYSNGELEILVHDETVEPDVERDPADTLLVALPGARTTVPGDPAFSFLGRPGAPVWVLPEVEDSALLWPGLSTEEIAAGVFEGDTVRLRLERVAGPGRVTLFTTGPTGAPLVMANSGDGLPDVMNLDVGAHLHANWTFSRAGSYALTFEATGRLPGGAVVSSGNVTIHFEVRR